MKKKLSIYQNFAKQINDHECMSTQRMTLRYSTFWNGILWKPQLKADYNRMIFHILMVQEPNGMENQELWKKS